MSLEELPNFKSLSMMIQNIYYPQNPLDIELRQQSIYVYGKNWKVEDNKLLVVVFFGCLNKG